MKKFIIIVLIIAVIAGVYIAVKHQEEQKGENQEIQNTVNTNVDSQNIVNTSNTNQEDNKEDLLKAMKSEKTFIDENNKEVLFKDYEIVEKEKAKPQKYTYVDLDKDGKEELVVLTTSDYGAYIILKNIDDQIYGYKLNIRAFESLKKDGSFIGSNGAANNDYCIISFEKNKYTIKKEATFDETNKKYIINNEDVTKEEIQKYADQWNNKEDVTWTNY